jgi:UDP-4-amino-4-deoxy-L-arabinose formyltransferase/UDP-glucuronic acid dehydrogenase (UDP-4-keto-hexauronic acid decarboxylating)
MRFAALGRTAMLLDAIQACAAAGHEAVMVGTAKPAPEYKVGPKDFERVSRELNCPYFCASTLDTPTIVELILSCRPDVAISVNWPTLIVPTVLAKFPQGILNAHAGDLPRYRGNACPNWAILAREPSMAVTIHRMVAELDAGPVLARREMSISPNTYVGDIYTFLRQAVPALFVQVLDDLEQEVAIVVDQSADPARSLRCFPRIPSDSEIDWRESAEHLAALVRASAEPFGGAFTYWHGERLIIWRARAEDLPHPWMGAPGQVAKIMPETGEVVVLCGQGILVLEQVQYGRVQRCPAAEVISSNRARLGADVPGELSELRRRVEEIERLMSKLPREP